MLKALRSFSDEADQADWALVYYAGHGIEVGGVNYLLPIDVELREDRDAEDEAISLDRVLRAVEKPISYGWSSSTPVATILLPGQ